MSGYQRREFVLPGDWEEPFSALQWAAGCCGVEVRGAGERIEMSVFFAPDTEIEPFDEARWAEEGIQLTAEIEQQDLDWAANYRRHAQPVRIGSLVLDPREPDSEPLELAEGETWLRIPARTAFGTGSHSSTGLALRLLTSCDVEGRRVLDVGTGTGVLAFAARLDGASEVLAFDIDPAAAFVAEENLALNHLDGIRFFAGQLACIAPSAGPLFDLVLINILPHRVREELSRLEGLVAPSSELVFSGLTHESQGEIREILEALGWKFEKSASEGEWVALRFCRCQHR